MLTDTEMLDLTIETLGRQFPKPCSCCGRVYPSLRDYISSTKRLGTLQAPDIDAGDWKPLEPLGIMAMANCDCGSTLSLTSEGVGLRTLWRMFGWARETMKRRGISFRELRAEFVDMVDRRVMADPASRATTPAPPRG